MGSKHKEKKAKEVRFNRNVYQYGSINLLGCRQQYKICISQILCNLQIILFVVKVYHSLPKGNVKEKKQKVSKEVKKSKPAKYSKVPPPKEDSEQSSSDSEDEPMEMDTSAQDR